MNKHDELNDEDSFWNDPESCISKIEENIKINESALARHHKDNIDDFNVKLKDNIKAEKERTLRDKTRISIMEELVKQTTIDLPQILIDQELARMEEEFSADLARMGMELNKYLEQVKKTRDDMHKEWKDDAIARAKTQIIAAKIAEVEHLEPSKEDQDLSP